MKQLTSSKEIPMTADDQMRAAALEMAKDEGLHHFSTLYLAMHKGAAIALADVLTDRKGHYFICADCGKCGEAQ